MSWPVTSRRITWEDIENDPGAAGLKKFVWKLCRQFETANNLEEEFHIQNDWTWSILRQSGGPSEQLIRLLLESGSGLRSECIVLLPKARQSNQPRAAACVSSQFGCAVGCPFCATGSLGRQGNLHSGQILEQVYLAGVAAKAVGRRLRNVVFMGMGEPLHNSAAVFRALEVMISDRHFGIPPRRITVSTAGVPAQMLRLAENFPRVRIALSLHAATEELRLKLVPQATSDLPLLHKTVRQINNLQPETPVWLEVVLLAGINDAPEYAEAVVQFCRGLRVEANLIPYNATSVTERYLPSDRSTRERFARILREAGIRTTLRTSFGANRNAACGQLIAS